MVTIRAVLVAAMAGAVVASPIAQDGIRFSDLGVYAAVLEHTIRPLAVQRRGVKASKERLLVADRSIALCGAARDPEVRCISPEELRDFAVAAPAGRQLFGDLLPAENRTALSTSFDARNRQSGRLPRWDGPEASLLNDSGLRQQSAALSSRSARGFAGFSRPAYSTSGHAVVYAFYVCGNLCGYGWLILLHHGASGWQVLATHGLWVS